MILDNKTDRPDIFNTSPAQLALEIELKRKEINYKDLSARFGCLQKDFKKQFAHIYAGRLMMMKERLIKSCTNKWGQGVPIRKLSELSDENNEKCIVIGTIFKHQELKPSILKDLSEENQVLPQPPRSNYVSDTDQLILEDEIQRIKLIGMCDTKKFVTGVVVGLLGFENVEGKFEVEDICFAEVEVGIERPLLMQDDSYLVLLSGLSVGNPETTMALELLTDFLKGDLGSVSDQEKWSKVCRVLIAGNSVMSTNTTSNPTQETEGLETLAAVKELDTILKELVRSVEVDLMPGEFDPSNHILPQQAIYDCVFPKACQYESFHCVTNPYEFELGGRRILGTSGQPINNIKAFTDMEDSLDILEKTLYWGHLAPSAPDTLACYPYYNEDPFIITHQPDIYFAGNQAEFQTKIITQNGHSTRAICIPKFCTNRTCIMVNLKNLECTPVIFTA